ncbi:MAG: chromosome segregation protein SMC, partial [Myxococcota bacterium]
NMRALEEYEEHEKRKNDLESELERLESEREGLLELADELVGKKKDALMKVFHEINENFQRTFSELSGGGAAELALENEVDPFQGGLILRSQPPGKKVQRLEALSGGEKSLTALSFIFAVQL